jgi:hypothetical protein
MRYSLLWNLLTQFLVTRVFRDLCGINENSYSMKQINSQYHFEFNSKNSRTNLYYSVQQVDNDITVIMSHQYYYSSVWKIIKILEFKKKTKT